MPVTQFVCCSSKKTEVESGVDGFMVYDVKFIPAVKAMFDNLVPGPNQLNVINEAGQEVKPSDLLQIPEVNSHIILLISLRYKITQPLHESHHLWCTFIRMDFDLFICVVLLVSLNASRKNDKIQS